MTLQELETEMAVLQIQTDYLFSIQKLIGRDLFIILVKAQANELEKYKVKYNKFAKKCGKKFLV